MFLTFKHFKPYVLIDGLFLYKKNVYSLPAVLVWPLVVKSVSMLVQECSRGTLFSEIISIKKTLFSDMFGSGQPFSLRNNHLSCYCCSISNHPFSLISRFIKKFPPFLVSLSLDFAEILPLSQRFLGEACLNFNLGVATPGQLFGSH